MNVALNIRRKDATYTSFHAEWFILQLARLYNAITRTHNKGIESTYTDPTLAHQDSMSSDVKHLPTKRIAVTTHTGCSEFRALHFAWDRSRPETKIAAHDAVEVGPDSANMKKRERKMQNRISKRD